MADKKRILIVEDDDELLFMLEKSLSSRGFDVVTVSDGLRAFQMAKNEKFDLILLDIMMPGMDGYHIAHGLATSMGENAPKILIMSGRNLQIEKGVALLTGAVSFLRKPFHLDDLNAKIAEALKKA